MPVLRRPDAELYYEVHGSGPFLVFAHGLGGSHLTWWQQVPRFRDRFACVVFAHRGFAPSSSRLPPERLPDAFVDDLEALLGELGATEVRLVAQSMGGWTCLGYALRHPERVRALVLACTTGSLRHDIAPPPGAEDLAARGIHPAAGERMAREQPALHHLYREIDALSLGLDKEAVRRRLHELAVTPPEEVAGIGVPLLCLSGAEDVVIAPEAVRRLASLVPGASFELVPEAGHSVYFERPQRFNELVAGFLG